MTRKIVQASSHFPFHITARTVNREIFPIPMDILWSIFGDYLYLAHAGHGVKIYSFVLMKNHFHLLARFPQNNMGPAMGYFMGETSRQISKCSGRINQIYGRRYHKSLILCERYFRHAYKYVYRNPVKAGHCQKVENYHYSTLHGILGKSKVPFPIEEDTQLFNPSFSDETLTWLNKQPHSNHDDEIRLALRRNIFQLAKDKNSKRPSELENSDF